MRRTGNDVAVTTASGGVLDSLVCETTEGAERCVAYLRSQNLGTATFVMLDRLSYLTPHAVEKKERKKEKN